MDGNTAHSTKEPFLKKDEAAEKTDLLKKRIDERHFTHQTQFEDDIPIIYIGGRKAMSLGNFSVITGKQKTGKGFTLSLIVNGFLNGDPQQDVFAGAAFERKRVVYIDTEQSGSHAKRLVNTVRKLDGNEQLIDGYWLRGFAPDELKKAVVVLVEKYKDEACLFIIDGIKDLSNSGINDETESTKIAVMLMDLTAEFNIHIIVVIHQNKKDGNATGFLGGDMVKKAELTLAITKDKEKKTHQIYPEDSRDYYLEPYWFIIDEDVRPILIDKPRIDNSDRSKIRPDHLSEDAHKEMINNIWDENTHFTTTDLIPQIQFELVKKDWEVGKNIASFFVTYWMQKRWIKNRPKGKSNQYSIIPLQVG